MKAAAEKPATEAKVAALCHGVEVPMSPYLTPERIERINAARYEGQEIAGVLSVVRPGDRVLEMGAGIGLVGAIIARNCAPAQVLSFEANPDLIPHINTLYDLNNLSGKIAVRHQVLLATPEPPSSVPFHVSSSYLGSSLIERRRNMVRKIDVATARFADVQESFSPSVLVMDIEGAELEFLRNADLKNIRAVVIEFHPGAYGTEGMRECKRILTTAGLAKVAEHSSRKVWTCERAPARVPPDPKGGWSTHVETIEDAIVVPPTTSELVQAAGVLYPDGRPCPQADLWRNGRPLTNPPERPDDTLPHRKGTWIWGGVLWGHFGHFMVESLSRLWTQGDAAQQTDGILFVPKRPRKGSNVAQFQRDLIAELGWDVPVIALGQPERIERLIVPGQGFGLGSMIEGTEAFRTRVKSQFGARVTPSGPKRLYISRSALPAARGGLIAEPVLEAHLAAEGYTIFHPQQHDALAQIATYKAADQIIAAEGSALHLLAMVARPDQDIAVVVRRPSGATRNLDQHLRSFAGKAPMMLSHVTRSWTPRPNAKPRDWQGELDLPALQGALKREGYIGQSSPDWHRLTDDQVMAALGPDYSVVPQA